MFRLQSQRPFADWLADVDRRLERRTGERMMTNRVSSDYWQSLYHMGESAHVAADEMLEDWRKR